MRPTRPQIPNKVTGSYSYLPPNLRSPFPPGKTGIPDLPSQVPGLAHAAAPAAPTTLTQQAQAQIDPILKKLTDAITARAQGAGKAITGYTNSLASTLGATDYAAPYRAAEGQQAAVDAALHQALTGGGAELASDLSTRLAQIGDPSVAAAASGLADRGAAIGNTELASGSSNLGALIANAASAGGYGAKMPGIARLAGLQDLAGANQKAQTDIRDQTAQVETQLPSIVNALRSAHATQQSLAEHKREFGISSGQSDKKTKAALILANGIDPATGTLTPQASKALTKLLGVGGLTGVSATVVQRANASNATTTERTRHDQASETQAAANARERVTHDTTIENISRTRLQAQTDPKLSISTSRGLGYRADQYGNPLGGKVTLMPGFGYDAHGNVVKHGSSTKSHGLTTNEVQKKNGLALTIAQTTAKGGQFDASGNPSPNGGYNSKKQPAPPLSYTDALLEMEKEGVPDWLAIPALNRFYTTPTNNPTVPGPPAPGK